MFILELAVILLMLAVNAMFAGYEMALASISRARLLLLTQQNAPGAADAAYMKENMEASLAVVQLGITFAGAIAAAVGGAGAAESFAPYFKSALGLSPGSAEALALVCIVAPLSGVTILFAELVPKTFAIANNELWCLKLSPAMRMLSWFARPVIAFFEGAVKRMVKWVRRFQSKEEKAISRAGLHELHAAATLARNSRLIGAREERIVIAAAHLAGRAISDIMLPAEDVSMIPADSNLMEALILAHSDLHTRFPVCSVAGDPQTTIGYINFKDIVVALKMSSGLPGVRGIMREIKRVQEGANISQALEDMMREKIHIAMVVSAAGKITGMLTIQDIINELVGHIEDEYDRLPVYLHHSGQGWITGGGVGMGKLFATLGLRLPTPSPGAGPQTLAQWTADQLGRPPKGGDIVHSQGIAVVVRKLRRHKVAEAFVNALEQSEAGPGRS